MIPRSFPLAAALVCLFVGFAYALDFSADMVTIAQGQQMNGKIYVSGQKIRMDMAGTSTITRIDKQLSWVIMPDQGMYMEQAFDPERIAGAVEKMPGEIERAALGADTVDGRSAKKYRITYAGNGRQATILQWIDDATGVPVKTAAEDGSWTMEYKNLAVGPQPDTVFEIPQGLQKFAVPTMADMMKAAGRMSGGGE